MYTKWDLQTKEKNKMVDIFDAKILCKNCDKEMEKTIVERNGLELRAVQCMNCGEKIIHPADLNGLEHFNDLRRKTFNVKLRMVGNSHTISIPKEILSFMEDQHKIMKRQMDDMVRLCFEDFGTLRLSFGDEFENDREEYIKENDNRNKSYIKLNGIRIKKVKNGGNGR